MSPRIALVTGAAGGIGRAIANRLARDGFNVVVNDIPAKRDKLEAVANEVRATGRQSIAVTADVSSDTEVKGMVDRAVGELGGLHVMVANAAVFSFDSLVDTTVEEYRRVTDVNILGVYNCYAHAARKMIEQGQGGHIVGACSVAGLKGLKNSSLYGMSKFAVRGLTQHTACELRPHNIAVNAYAPGLVNTEWLLKSNIMTKDTFEKIGIPRDTTGTSPENIASVVSFLASADPYLTGQTISPNGGSTFQ